MKETDKIKSGPGAAAGRATPAGTVSAPGFENNKRLTLKFKKP